MGTLLSYPPHRHTPFPSSQSPLLSFPNGNLLLLSPRSSTNTIQARNNKPMGAAIDRYRLALLAACGVAALISVAFGQIQFAGYDASPLVDIGWRLHLGQHPYADFPCMLPPSFYALSWLAVAVFGDH